LLLFKEQIATQKRELARFGNLVKLNAANQKQVDDIQSQLSVLEKQLAAQTELLVNNNQGISGESTALESQIAQIEDQLLKSRITSPIQGTVLTKYAEQGEFTAPGKALFKVSDMQQMYLRAYITSDQLTQLKQGQPVTVYADFGEDKMRTYPGTISWIADKAEFTPKTIQTRNERANLVYAVKIAVTNDGYLKNGMYGEVKFNATKP
jgi:HlyD family secretion protein